MNWWMIINAAAVLSMTGLILASGIACADILQEFLSYRDPSKARRRSVVAFDVDSTAAHVYLSEWRYYLDVDRYNRAIRNAKMWLKA